MSFIQKLREEFNQIKGEMAAEFAKVHETEKRTFSAEEQTAFDAKSARLDAIEKTIAEHQKFAARKVEAGEVILPKEPEGKAEFQAENKGNIVVGETKIDRAEFNSAAAKWALTGQMDRKFATITTATGSGILLPTAVATPDIHGTPNPFREAFGLYGVPVLSTQGTEKINLPVLTAGSGGGAVAEDASSETGAGGDIGGIVLQPSTYQSGSEWISGLQLAANGYDLLGYVQTMLADQKELRLEEAIAAALIADAGITQGVDLSDPNGITYAEMVSLNNSLPKRYNRQKVMILDGELITALEQLVGSDGHPILVRDPQNQNVIRFNGTPVLRCDAFGNFSDGTEDRVYGVCLSLLGFKLRDAGQQKVERHTLPTKPDQVGLNLISYHAYGWTDAAIAKIKG